MKAPKRLLQSIKLGLSFVAIMWVVHVFQFITTIDLGYLGIRPHAISGLKGILFAPLVHGDFSHLISNSAPLLVLIPMIHFFYRRVANRTFISIYLITGLAVWLLARPTYHIGASGVVYGLFGFVLFSGFFRKNIRAIVLSLIVAFFYSGILFGILPGQPGISWESHLFGLLAGIFMAYWYKEEIERDEKPEPLPAWATAEENPLDRPFFLQRDIFDKTKEQRRIEEEQCRLALERMRIEAERRRLEEERRKLGGEDSWFSSNTTDF